MKTNNVINLLNKDNSKQLLNALKLARRETESLDQWFRIGNTIKAIERKIKAQNSLTEKQSHVKMV
jgi:hypothetical protein